MYNGLFSMYSSKGKRPTFFIYECAYPNHKETELGFLISNSVGYDISRNMKYCVRDIVRNVVKQSHNSDLNIRS